MLKLDDAIDEVPELPYFMLAICYAALRPEDAVRVFSAAFVFLVVSLFVGTLLKALFRTSRPTRYGRSVFRFGFPSMHSMISVGGVAFVYHINPVFSLVLLPIGALYMYSRLRARVHSLFDVASGGTIGAVIGFYTGQAVAWLSMPGWVEIICAALVFIVPIAYTFIRFRFFTSESK
ncbi:MAG: hypothetical protein MSIBF_04550 [Candidatus Altiarchaeales archaeon IMC4]|nr:MAG: hypothetical protein MSIBF_04550 [Candidatus Altiarchaeales archaeon IMC4]